MPVDLIELLVAEHRRLESLFADVETASSPPARRAALDVALDALDRHAAAEAALLHPALRAYLPAGPEIADYEAGEHASFAVADRSLLLDDPAAAPGAAFPADVEVPPGRTSSPGGAAGGAWPSSGAFAADGPVPGGGVAASDGSALAPRLVALLDAVRLHMQEEETELFPRLAAACPDVELRRLGELLPAAGSLSSESSPPARAWAPEPSPAEGSGPSEASAAEGLRPSEPPPAEGLRPMKAAAG